MMKRIRKSILMLLTASLLLWGCGDAQKSVTFSNNRFQIAKPAKWVAMNDLNEGADIGIGNLFKEAYLIVFSESKADFDDMNLVAYSELTRRFMKETLKDYKEVSGPTGVTVGDLQGVQYEITGSIEGMNLKYLHTALEGREHFHQIVAWSLSSKYDANLSDYRNTISSFKEL